MTAQRPLVFRAQEQAAEELSLHAQVKVLARRIVHVDVHGANGDSLSRMGDRVRGVIGSADACRTRIEDSIASVSIKIDQRVERWVPSTVGPDVVEDAVIEDAVAAADGHLAFPLRIPGKTDARTKVMVLCVPHPAHRIHSRRANAGGIRSDIAAG